MTTPKVVNSDTLEESEINHLLLEGLTPIIPDAKREKQLRLNLMQRVAQSLSQEANLLTVRIKDGIWKPLSKGIRFKLLWQGFEGNSVLIEFAPGAELSAHRHLWLEEGMVLRGGLQMSDLDLGTLDYHLSTVGSRHAKIQSRQGALAFLRGTSLGKTSAVLQEFVGGFLPHSGQPSLTVFAHDNQHWETIAPGVTRKILSNDDNRISYFCRLAPGAELPEHDHPQDEECMLLQGDLFLGDLLLRAFDYQLALKGSRHGKIFTDTGAILFVRGAKG